MHELGLMTGIMDAVLKTAENAGADKVTEIKLTVGEMTEVVEEAMVFAFEALSEGTMCEGAKLDLTIVHPRSRCLECGAEYDHDASMCAVPNAQPVYGAAAGSRDADRLHRDIQRR